MAKNKAPNGARAIYRQISDEVKLGYTPKQLAKHYKVTPPYIQRILHLGKENRLGELWRSKKAVTIWGKRIAGEGKQAGPRKTSPRASKPKEDKPKKTGGDEKPKDTRPPIEQELSKKNKRAITFTTDNGHTVIILPSNRKPKPRGVKTSHVINGGFGTAQEAARFLGEIGPLASYAYVAFDKDAKAGEQWRIYVCESENELAKVVNGAERFITDIGEGENEY